MSYYVQTVKSTAGIKAENAKNALSLLRSEVISKMYNDMYDQDYINEIEQKLDNVTVLGQALMILDDSVCNISGKFNKQGNYTNLYLAGNICSAEFDAVIYTLEKYGHGKLTLIGEDGHISKYNFS